ncbi:MAG: hypothetical protein JW893_08990 [Candidatus Omnitrophica bacterium]|nr:hypothetical protein [Candidatus Omnitrophota bacterium]
MKPRLVAKFPLVSSVVHWVVGMRKKAATLFVIDLKIADDASSNMIDLFYGCAVPAVIEAYVLARGGVNPFSELKLSIALLLLVTGFSAHAARRGGRGSFLSFY